MARIVSSCGPVSLISLGHSTTRVEIGPVMLKKIAKHTGLKPEDL
jgi:hypothetical protein